MTAYLGEVILIFEGIFSFFLIYKWSVLFFCKIGTQFRKLWDTNQKFIYFGCKTRIYNYSKAFSCLKTFIDIDKLGVIYQYV